jgi:hypothetical protein
MYNVWLGLNILWEAALLAWLPIAVALVLWAVLMGVALGRRGSHWRGGLRVAALAALGVAVVAFFALPGATQSSLAEMGYWVDWVSLAGLALACGAFVAAYAWPIGAMVCRKPAAP